MARRSPGVGVHLAALAASVAMLAGLAATTAGQAPPAAPAPQQTAAAAPAGDGDATARITGQVVAADTGAPIKRAAVSVLGGTPRSTAGAPGLSVAIAAGPPGSLPPGMIRRQVATDEPAAAGDQSSLRLVEHHASQCCAARAAIVLR